LIEDCAGAPSLRDELRFVPACSCPSQPKQEGCYTAVAMILTELLAECGTLSRAEFEAAHPHACLLREIQPGTDRNAQRFGTTLAAHAPWLEPQALEPRRVALTPELYHVYPLSKSGRNPWLDHILIGRADNNDVVFKDLSVSKVQAYFSNEPQKPLRLFAHKTRNPTMLDGTIVPPGEPGVAVSDGATIQVGNVYCHLLEMKSLFALVNAVLSLERDLRRV
jgi:hypothetical protein